jgi:hypothetical protein
MGLVALSDDAKVLVTEDKSLVAWDVASTHKLTTVSGPEVENSSAAVIGWRGRTAIVAFEPLTDSAKPTYQAWNADTGTHEPLDARSASNSAIAPDGSRRIDFADGKAIVTPLPTGTPRTLRLYPRDYAALADSLVQWLDSRTVAISGRRYWAVLDTDAMKVSLLPTSDDPDDERRIEVLIGTGHVVVDTGGKSYLATLKP